MQRAAALLGLSRKREVGAIENARREPTSISTIVGSISGLEAVKALLGYDDEHPPCARNVVVECCSPSSMSFWERYFIYDV